MNNEKSNRLVYRINKVSMKLFKWNPAKKFNRLDIRY
jgi:hypothetical protein